MFYSIIKFLVGVFLRIFYKVRVVGIENVPVSGKLVICSNHASNWDPLFISIVFPRQISWMAKKELFKNRILSSILYKLGAFPVDRGDTDITAIKNALKVLKSDKVLGIFPEGTRVKGFDLNNAKPGVALLTVKSNATVLPIHISSNYRLFNKIKVNIGEPITFSSEDVQAKDYTKISQQILYSIYDLKE